jgi:cytosine/adenosine deaminase-related metal-dependent hydrolase
LSTGTTTVLDVFRPNSPAFFEAARTLGIRAYGAPYIANHVIKGLDGQGRPIVASSDTRSQLRKLEHFMTECEHALDDRVRLAFGPHCTDTCDPDLLRGLLEMRDGARTILTIHVAQSRTEVREISDRYGKSPVEHLIDCGVSGPGIVYAHGTFAEQSDLRLMAADRTALGSCPVVFAQSGRPIDFKRFVEHGVPTSIGTDGHSPSLLDEMRAAGLLSRAISGTSDRVTASELYDAATAAPAAALQRQDLGSIRIGAQADLVVHTLDPLVNPAGINPLQSIVWQPGAAAVDTVLVAGEMVVRGGRPVRIDLEALIDQVSAAVTRVWRRAERDLGIVPTPW